MNSPNQRGCDPTLARRIRDLWITAVRDWYFQQNGRESMYEPGPKWDGGKDSRGRMHQPIWPKVASRVKRYNVRPESVVGMVFANRMQSTMPWPNALLSDKLYQKVIEQTALRPREEALSLNAQLEAFRLAYSYAQRMYVTRDSAYRAVLTDPGVQLSALIRVALADKLGLPDVAELYLEDAVNNYRLAADVYDEVWGEHVPDCVRGNSAELAFA